MCERRDGMKASSDEMDEQYFFFDDDGAAQDTSHNVDSMKMICQYVTSVLIWKDQILIRQKSTWLSSGALVPSIFLLSLW